MNTDKEKEEILTIENNTQEHEELWNLNSIDPGCVVAVSLVFSSSVFICVHLWFQTDLPCV